MNDAITEALSQYNTRMDNLQQQYAEAGKVMRALEIAILKQRGAIEALEQLAVAAPSADFAPD